MDDNFKKLNDFQHVRQRTEMYYGAREPHTQTMLCFDGLILSIKEQTWIPSLYTIFRELVDNALDEIVGHGYGDTIKISYDPNTMVISVGDNGRGMPIDEKKTLGKGPAASILMSEARSGRNFGDRGTVAGVNGIGASGVNFTAEWFILEVWRDNKYLKQRWSEGTYNKQEIHKTDGPIIDTGTTKTGTLITFKPSDKVWRDMILPLEFIESRVWDIALTNPKLSVYFNDTLLVTEGKDPITSTLFKDRTVSMLEIKNNKIHAKYYAVVGCTDDEHIHSIVNNIPVLQGGPHIDEFRSLFYTSLIKLLDPKVKKALNISSRSGNILNKTDVTTDMMIYNVTMLNDPHFDSQSKTRLVSEVKTDIRNGFFESDVSSFIRKNPQWTAEVIERCRSRTTNAINKSLAKDQKKLSKSKIETLRDATGNNRNKCVLFVTEGNSAAAGLVAARDATIHGILPLRGKIMNVTGVSVKKVMSSEALTNIMASVGLKIGERANTMHLRYGRIYITTDSDEDGKNISSLLVNFLFTFWPELFSDPNNPIVYQFDTPLIILTKGTTRKYIYAEEYAAFKPTDWHGWGIIRAKGLARLTQPDWKNAIECPKLIPLVDTGGLKEVLSLIFDGSRADDRKKWLS